MATVSDGRVEQVAFRDVASVSYHEGVEIETVSGAMTVPIVFGRAFYALAHAADASLKVDLGQARELIEYGVAVKQAVEETLGVVHPEEQELMEIYGTITTGPPSEGADGRNVTIFADGEVDRSPCGTGTAARLAWLHATGQIGIDQPYVHESIISPRFTGRVLDETNVTSHPAIIPEIAGRGHITGWHTFVIDPNDLVSPGFLVR